MSFASAGNVTPVLTLDRRLAFTQGGEFAVVSGGVEQSWRNIATQSYGDQEINFVATPNNAQTALSRDVKVKVQFQVTINAIAGASGLVIDPGVFDAPRAFPLAQVTGVIKVQLNNTTLTQNNYQLVNTLLRCNLSDEDYKWNASTAPSMLDYYANYNDSQVNGEGIVKDPLQKSGQSSQTWEPRGGWTLDSLVNPNVGTGNPGTAVLTFTTTEGLLLSPFLTTTDDRACLIGLNTFNVNFSLLANLSRVWSHSDSPNASTITSMAVHVNAPPSIMINQIVPSQITPLPKSVSYSYSTVTPYQTNNIPPVPPGGTFSVTSNNIQLGIIPRRIYVWVARSIATQTVTTSDTFLRIDQANLTFDTASGIFSEATTEQLYEISRQAGLNMSFIAWKRHTGSIFVIDVGKSLLLRNEAEAPSLTTNKSFQITINGTNISTTDTITPTLWIATCADGLLQITEGLATTDSAVLSVDDIARVKAENKVVSYDRSSNFYGGMMRRADGHGGASFFSKLSKAANVLHNVAKQTGFVSKAATALGHPEIGAAAAHYGYGMAGGEGGGLVGGRRASKAGLMRRAMMYGDNE